MSKRRTGASNGARSTCCLPKPPGFKASGRRFGKSVASYVRAESRRTASGRSSAIRNHWAIENQNHWVRDVTLAEDVSRIRINPSIMARLRSQALRLFNAHYRPLYERLTTGSRAAVHRASAMLVTPLARAIVVGFLHGVFIHVPTELIRVLPANAA